MKHIIKNIKIGKRLGFGFGLMILSTTIIGLFAISQMQKLSNLTEQIYLHPFAVSNAVRDIRTNINGMHRSIKDIALAESIEKIAEATFAVSQCEKKVYKNFAIIFECFLGDQQDVTNAYNLFSDWKAIREEVILLRSKGKKIKVADITIGKCAEHIKLMTNSIQIMADFADKKAKQFRSDAQIKQRNIIMIMALLISIMMIIGIFISISITQSIVTPLNIIVKKIRDISQGHLQESVEIDQNDEVGELADSFNDLQNDLIKKVGIANQITSGNFSITLEPRTEKDDLGKAFYAMTTSLKQSKYDLEGSELKYQNMVETLPVGISISTADGKILDANKSIIKIFGFDSKEEIINYPASEFYYHPEGRKTFLDQFKKYGMIKNLELELKRKDGVKLWGSITSVAQKNPQYGTIYITSFTDITENRNTRIDIDRAHDIIQHSPAIIFIWKNVDGWPVEFVTNNVEQLYGYSDQDFLSGKVIYEKTIHPDDLKKVGEEVVKNSVEEGKIEFIHEPYRIITKDGGIKWVRDITKAQIDSEGNITHYQGVILDITEVITAEHEINKSEERFELLFNSANDAIFIYHIEFDHKLGTFIEVNDIACERLNYTREEMLQMSAHDITNSDEADIPGIKEKILDD
ncbi:PAS domain S-box protein, partial [bacterium]|nr:PAS domain S-box protein [bacterium]